jgi:hypothetical protein
MGSWRFGFASALQSAALRRRTAAEARGVGSGAMIAESPRKKRGFWGIEEVERAERRSSTAGARADDTRPLLLVLQRQIFTTESRRHGENLVKG